MNSLISTVFSGMEERSDMGVVQVFDELPSSEFSCEDRCKVCFKSELLEIVVFVGARDSFFFASSLS